MPTEFRLLEDDNPNTPTASHEAQTNPTTAENDAATSIAEAAEPETIRPSAGNEKSSAAGAEQSASPSDEAATATQRQPEGGNQTEGGGEPDGQSQPDDDSAGEAGDESPESEDGDEPSPENEVEVEAANAVRYPLSTNSVAEAGAPVDDPRAYPLPLLIAPRPPRPVAPRVNFEGLPANLPQGRHYVLWRYEWVENKKSTGAKHGVKGRYTKVPQGPNGYRVSVTDKANLLTLAEVRQSYLSGLVSPNPRLRFDGIGLVLDPEMGLVAIDLDHQRGADGSWSAAALSIIASVNSYSEYSPGGDGIRILAFGKLPTGEIKNGDFENFQQNHFVTTTGQHIPGTPALIEARPEEVAAYHTRYVVKVRNAKFAPKKPGASVGGSRSTGSHAARSRLTKEQILEKAARGSNGAKFIDYYRNGPASTLGPKKGDGSADQSAMDLFVCGVLAKFSGGDAEMMDEMMRESALMRPKWDRSAGELSYGQLTIRNAIAGCREFYDPLTPEFAELSAQDIPAAKGIGRNNAPAYGSGQVRDLLHAEWDVQALDTEAAHARRIAHYLAGELCNVDGLGWLRYNGRHWEVDNRGNKRTLARVAQLSKYVSVEATHLYGLAAKLSGAGRAGDAAAMSEAAKSVGALARKVENKRFIADSVELAAGRPEISRHIRAFEPRDWVIPFDNGVWDQGEFREHRAEDCVLHLCRVEVDAERLAELEAQIAAELESDPEADVALKPFLGTQWGQVLERITAGDPLLARTLQEVAGYAMSGSPYLRTILWAYGARGTGKGTFTELLKTVLGDNAVALDPKSLSSRGDRERLGAQLAHKRLGVCAEAGNKQFDAELFKTMSGADTMTARRLYNEHFDAEPHQVLCLVSNDAPRMEAYDEALRERILVLPFDHAMDKGGQFSLTGGKRLEQVRRQPDSPLVREFTLWALVGAKRVMDSGQIFRAPKVESAIETFWKDTDRMRRFWETVPLSKLHHGIFGNQLRDLYHYWCEGMRIQPQYRLGEKELRKAFFGIGLTEGRVGANNVRGYRLPRDPNRVCSRVEKDVATGKTLVVELNIYGEPVINGDAAGHPAFRQEDCQKAELDAHFDAMLDRNEADGGADQGAGQLALGFEGFTEHSALKKESKLDAETRKIFGNSKGPE